MLKIVEVALNEVGYLEKKSNSQLDDKTANAGSGNYTKYWVWYGSLQGEPWCAAFVSWCAYVAGVLDAVGGKFSYCPSWVNHFKQVGQWHNPSNFIPKPGDIIFFGEAAHVGIVEDSDGTYVYTIEGNTSGASGLIANGGGVCRKTYRLTENYIMGYGRPDYGTNNNSEETWSWGIDVSEHNGNIDWKKVKQAGVQYAIIRAGYGKNTVDGKFYANIQGAIANDIPVGIYWFTYALDINGVKAEAKKCLDTIKGYNISLPVFFDFEYDTIRYANENGVTLGKTEFNNHTVAFCEAIKEAGYIPGTYYNLDYYNRFVDKNKIGQYFTWYAQYASSPSITNFDMWQYSSTGKVDGIAGNVDMNWKKNTAPLTPGWKKDENGWWYDYGDGTYPVSQWLKIDGEWYYFKESGYMAEQEIVDNKYYVGKDGTLVSNKTLRTDENGCIVEAESWYHLLKDVPQKYRKELDLLIAEGKFKGHGGEGEDLIIDGPESLIRAIIITNS